MPTEAVFVSRSVDILVPEPSKAIIDRLRCVSRNVLTTDHCLYSQHFPKRNRLCLSESVGGSPVQRDFLHPKGGKSSAVLAKSGRALLPSRELRGFPVEGLRFTVVAMDGLGPDWKGLLKWSVANSDGTQPPREVSEEDRRFFAEAMQSQTVDVIRRMKEIVAVMNLPGETLEVQVVTAEELEGMLEELQEHVESIDMANDLHAIGGLVPLLGYLKHPHASIRARAAEVVSTTVQNNPRSQQQVIECNGLENLLVNFNFDDDIKVRTKALGAISSLIRHNKVATDAFRLSNGYAGLREALAWGDLRFQRKALQVMQYLLEENPKDHNVATQLGFLRSLTSLANCPDLDVRQAALQALVEIVRNQDNQNPGKFDDTTRLKDVITRRIAEIKSLNHEDLAAVKEERQLLDALWQLLYKEPSELRQEGLLVLPEDNQLPPDVASRQFAPGLSAGAPLEPPSGQNVSQEAASFAIGSLVYDHCIYREKQCVYISADFEVISTHSTSMNLLVCLMCRDSDMRYSTGTVHGHVVLYSHRNKLYSSKNNLVTQSSNHMTRLFES